MSPHEGPARACRGPVPGDPGRDVLRELGRAVRARATVRDVLGRDVGRPGGRHHGRRLPPRRARSLARGGRPAMSVALLIIVVFLGVAIGLALTARRGRDMDLEQWTAGGRGFGAIFVFLLMAGEIYSTFTFLGGAGLVYGSGGAAYYILGYGTLAYILSYWLLPAVWRYCTPRRLLSQADFFVAKFGSRALGVVVSVV